MEKIENRLDQSCIGKEILTKGRLALWCEISINSYIFYKQNGLYFPFKFKEVGLRAMKRYQFMLLREKEEKGELTEKEKVSLEKITLELQIEINEVNEIEHALMELKKENKFEKSDVEIELESLL